MPVQSVQEIVDQWRTEGRRFRIREAVVENQRQAIEAQREHETRLLEQGEQPGASEFMKEVAEQIRGHREAGNYTTQGNLPKTPRPHS